MRQKQLASADLSGLIELYRSAAAEHGDATERSDDKAANKAADTVAGIYAELRRRGEDAQKALLPLLGDPSPGVRVWAGGHALEFSPEQGEFCLKRLMTRGGLLGFNAEMTLGEWKAGRLKFP